MLKSFRPCLFIGSALIGLALFCVRLLASQFGPDTIIDHHPVGLLMVLLMSAGLIWLGLIPITRKYLSQERPQNAARTVMIILVLGMGFRALFLGSTPIYEDDWNRYLWDGAVIKKGINPYLYSPDVIDFSENPTRDSQRLKALSTQHDDFTDAINNPHLTTIYPPLAQAVFAMAAVIKPFNLDALRALYLLSEFLAMLLLLKALSVFGYASLWVWLYALNPLVIFTAFNGAHMDILLVPLILAAMTIVKTRPVMAALCLSGAVAIKIWPLILGPVLFRTYRHHPWRYVGYGLALGIISLILCVPMFTALDDSSGLVAYSATWQRSSFLFPMIEAAFTAMSSDGPRIARIFIAWVVGGLALWLGLKQTINTLQLPFALMLVTVSLYLLSPTGFPWYVIWFAFLIPFVPSYGIALLCVTTPLYYARFWFGENGYYDIYLNQLVPLQFGLPLLVLIFEILKHRKYAQSSY